MFCKERSESGRSMIELIAVLAVMAIIVIGGYLGWRYAIHRMFVNSIVQDLYAIDVQYQTDARTEPDLPTPKEGVSYDLIKNEEGRIIAYKVSGEKFDSKTCQQVADVLGDNFMMYDDCSKKEEE